MGCPPNLATFVDGVLCMDVEGNKESSQDRYNFFQEGAGEQNLIQCHPSPKNDLVHQEVVEAISINGKGLISFYSSSSDFQK